MRGPGLHKLENIFMCIFLHSIYPLVPEIDGRPYVLQFDDRHITPDKYPGLHRNPLLIFNDVLLRHREKGISELIMTKIIYDDHQLARVHTSIFSIIYASHMKERKEAQ